MKNFKKGISMITLVVTIIVMIIIAGTAIVSMSINNPIENAKISVLKTNVSQLIEEVDTYILSHRREKKKYPVKNAKVDSTKLVEGVKKAIALDQGKVLENGEANISDIDYSNVYYLDKKLMKNMKGFEEEIILTKTKNGGVELYFNTPKKIDDIEYYKLRDILFNVEK